MNCSLKMMHRRGAAATELALWLPFLGLMFVIALDYCRVFYASQTIQNCALAGAMFASRTSAGNPSTAEDPAVTAALAEGASLNPPLETSKISVVTSGGLAKVTVTYDFPMLVRWPGIGGTLTITKSVSMTTMPTPGN